MASTKLYINSIFVIDDAADARHGTIYQTFFLIQCSLLYLVRQRAWISEKAHVMDSKVTTTWHPVNRTSAARVGWLDGWLVGV